MHKLKWFAWAAKFCISGLWLTLSNNVEKGQVHMTKRILMVDDSRMVLDLLSFMISSAGYQVETANNGSLALELMAKTKVDLALVDLNMPVMDGFTLIRRIRKQPDWENLPIIIVTTEAEAEDRQRGIDAGADLYMTKPVEEAELLANIGMMIGNADE